MSSENWKDLPVNSSVKLEINDLEEWIEINNRQTEREMEEVKRQKADKIKELESKIGPAEEK